MRRTFQEEATETDGELIKPAFAELTEPFLSLVCSTNMITDLYL